MNQPEKAFALESSAITDRGLNERRPLNEDSFLADNQRGIFAVADGVGGAEAGEVASQTAIEVLDEAFRHQLDGADIEDLMELAIQRANASIHQMAVEHAKFSMMATTIVALHLKGNVATIGHVGDSRLYRLTPEGDLVRETEDHSVVEEEVRAGRMTPEQAANHPSKNVISRALGAEDAVEVDMKTIEIEDGTQFMLCSDGITRHVPDYELRQLFVVQTDLGAVCEELKRRCYERGAEDNLTAVLIRVGKTIPATQRAEDTEPTISPDTDPSLIAKANAEQTMHGFNLRTEEELIPPSRIAFPAPVSYEETHVNASERPLKIEDSPPAGRNFGRTVVRFLLFLVVLAAVAGAFYAGSRYKGEIPFLGQTAETIPLATPSPVVVEDPILKFERARREVDNNPAEWLANARKTTPNPLDSSDPEFLYLYGRASLLSGQTDEAAKAFEQAITIADQNPSTPNATVRKEAALGLAATTLKSQKNRLKAVTHFDEMVKKATPTGSPATP